MGFVGNRDPHSECPECWGEGVGRPFLTDIRKLGRESLQLYAGVKQTKDGLEIQMHNQADALDKLARHFGLYKDKLADAVEKSYTREALEERFAGAMQRAQERQRQVDEERRLFEIVDNSFCHAIEATIMTRAFVAALIRKEGRRSSLYFVVQRLRCNNF